MGPAARKSLALDLEKKAIQMALEEGEVTAVAMVVVTVLRGGSGGGWWVLRSTRDEACPPSRHHVPTPTDGPNTDTRPPFVALSNRLAHRAQSTGGRQLPPLQV